MKFVIAGYESSGTKWVSKYIAACLGIIENMGDWPAYDKIENKDHQVFHRSLPFGQRNNFIDIGSFGDTKDTNLIICVRDKNISLKSATNVHNYGNEKQAKELQHIARRILCDWINSDYKTYIFSYETGVWLGDVYFHQISDFFNIKKIDNVVVKDGNAKYLK